MRKFLNLAKLVIQTVFTVRNLDETLEIVGVGKSFYCRQS